MKDFEKFISPIIENQFPAIYREESPLFVAFMKAYYEWAESHLQEVIFDNPENFNVGDTITQGSVTGKIITKYNDYFYIVEPDVDEEFKCNTFCDSLKICTSSSGGSSYIATTRNYNTDYHARRLANFRDVDETIDKFIVQFKNKYLNNIQFNTASNKRLFIKNSLDFYRAKGTERAVDLFFKLIYGFEAKVYYPADDLFKPSDNEWLQREYLEVEPSQYTVEFVGKTIYGTNSDATAFVDSFVRVKKGSRFIHVLYLANPTGDFITDEQIYTASEDTNLTTRVVGSLTDLEIRSSSPGFEIGDILYVSNGKGKRAKAKVTETESFTGVVLFDLISGGWGYSDTAQVVGSENVLYLEDLTVENTEFFYHINPYEIFETLSQPIMRFTVDANSALFTTGSTVYANTTSGTFEGTILNTDSDNLYLNVNYDTGTYANTDDILTITEIHDGANNYANIDLVEDRTAIGTVMGTYGNVTISYTGSETLTIGDVIYHKNSSDVTYANGTVLEVSENTISGEKFAVVQRDVGAFRSNQSFYRESDSAMFSIAGFSNTSIGIINTTNQFFDNGPIIGANTGSFSNSIKVYSYDSKASFDIVDIDNYELLTNFASDDIIGDVASNTIIDTTAYGLSGNTAAGFDDVIGDAAIFNDLNVGSVEQIVVTDPGSGYIEDPFYIIYEPYAYHIERYDFILKYDEEEKNFLVGEIITGNSSGVPARITKNDRINKTIWAVRMNTFGWFEKGETITSDTTNITATLNFVDENRWTPRIGLNAQIESDALSGDGFAAALSVVDSGFGYFDGEALTFLPLVPVDDERIETIAVLGKQGTSEGFHINRRSFLSSDKYIHDNNYYQEYSYEVLTALPFETYRDTLIQVLHVAGSRPFGAYVGTSVTQLDMNLDSTSSTVEIEVKPVYVNEQTFFSHTIS